MPSTEAGICPIPITTVLRLARRDLLIAQSGQLSREARALVVECIAVTTAAQRLLININRANHVYHRNRVHDVRQ